MNLAMPAAGAALGFVLAEPTQRWNALLQERFRAVDWGEVRPSYAPSQA